MAFGAIFTDSKYFDAIAFKYTPLVAEIAGLFGATRGVVFWIKIQNNPAAALGLKIHHLAALIWKGEAGCKIAYLKCHGCRFGPTGA